jgi:hypothetical protein
MSNEAIEKKYEDAFKNAAAVNPVFPYAAKQQMTKMVEEIVSTNNILDDILDTNQNYFIKGGNAAEEFHAHGFNLDSILNDSDTRAYTDRRSQWYEHKFDGDPLGKNANPDLILSENGKVTKSYQSKYNKNAASTAGEMSQVVDGKPKYDKNDNYLGPSDQIDGIKKQSLENIRKNTERSGDPARREAYRQTHDKVTDRVTDGKSSSTELTKKEADEIGKGNTNKFKQLDNNYQTRSTYSQMGRAAVGAAAMSAVVSGSINTVRYIQLAREGKISAEEATVKIVAETISSAADSAVKASANAGMNSLIARYGTEKVIESFAKQGLQSMLRSNAVTVGVVCAVDAVKDLVSLGMGNISKEQFYERQGNGLVSTATGTLGGTLGAAGAAAVFGETTDVLALGGLSGGLIAGLAMSLAIENGVEKPYRDLCANTGAMREAQEALVQASRAVFMGQVVFARYLEVDARLEEQITSQFSRIDQAGQNALAAINKI